MKHVKEYESFGSGIRKFFTGHEDSESKESAKSKILQDIENNVGKLLDFGDITPENAEKYKENLIKRAKENNWKGKVTIRKSAASGKLFVVYDEGKSSLQDLGSAAGSATTKRW